MLRIILTGAPDSLPDLVLRCANLQMTLRESTSSYVSATVDPTQIDDVLARSNGKLEVYRVFGGISTRIVSTNQQAPRLDSGAQQRSYRLVGTTTASFAPFVTVDLPANAVVTDRLQEDGRKSWQISPSMWVDPGDTVHYLVDAQSYLIDHVQVVANAKGTQVIITEAVA